MTTNITWKLKGKKSCSETTFWGANFQKQVRNKLLGKRLFFETSFWGRNFIKIHVLTSFWCNMLLGKKLFLETSFLGGGGLQCMTITHSMLSSPISKASLTSPRLALLKATFTVLVTRLDGLGGFAKVECRSCRAYLQKTREGTTIEHASEKIRP